MESNTSIKIVVDAGHGGWDNGASFEGRLEKDDNLRLALATARELRARGADVIMTRDSDEYITLQDRAAIANAEGADLFISLHRNSYVELTPGARGVENFIYLTAPEETAGRAAALVLEEVVDVGVLDDRGVKRGNYYVLRRTTMPAMLLEMGYIINPEDNALFDQNLDAYAAAIARGALRYFGVEEQAQPPVTAVPLPAPAPQPPLQVLPSQNGDIAGIQTLLNSQYGANLEITGRFDDATRRAAVRALQSALNNTYNAALAEDGILGPQTLAILRDVKRGDNGNVVQVVQLLLVLGGYNPGTVDGVFGAATELALELFQRDHYLVPDGVAGPATLQALLDA